MGNIPCICGQPRDRYVHQKHLNPCHIRLWDCMCNRDKFKPLLMLGTYRWSLVIKTYRPHGVTPGQLEKLFKRAAMPDGSNPGAVRLRNWNRQFQHRSTRLLLRVLNPKGRDIRYLFYEQFLEMSFEFCSHAHAQLPQCCLSLFKPQLVKVSPSKFGAILRFLWGDTFSKDEPDIHAWSLYIRVDQFKGVREEKLNRDEGREKRAKGEWVDPEETQEFLLRYPVFWHPLLVMQRYYFRRVFGEKFWYEWHCSKHVEVPSIAPAGYFVDNLPHARMLSGRMLMLETILCRELRMSRWEGDVAIIPALEHLRPRLRGLDAAASIKLIYDASRLPSTTCLACGDPIHYSERTVHAYTKKLEVPASVASDALSRRGDPLPLPAMGRLSVGAPSTVGGLGAGSVVSASSRRIKRKRTLSGAGAGLGSRTVSDVASDAGVGAMGGVEEAKGVEGPHVGAVPGSVVGSDLGSAAPARSVMSDARGHSMRLVDRHGRPSMARSGVSLDLSAVASAKSRLEALLEAPKRLDTGFCTFCEKAVLETLADKYGYTFARGVLEFAKVQKVPTDVENWTAGRRKLDQSTQYTKVRLPDPDFTVPHTLYEAKRAPDDQLAELEVWYRFFDEGTEDYFYYNIATGEAQWQEPDEYVISEENQLGIVEEDVMSQVEAEDKAVKTHRI